MNLIRPKITRSLTNKVGREFEIIVHGCKRQCILLINHKLMEFSFIDGKNLNGYIKPCIANAESVEEEILLNTNTVFVYIQNRVRRNLYYYWRCMGYKFKQYDYKSNTSTYKTYEHLLINGSYKKITKCGVYIFVNEISGVAYIGSTITNFKERLYSHYNSPNSIDTLNLISNEHTVMNILYTCTDDEELDELLIKERDFILEYKNKYNLLNKYSLIDIRNNIFVELQE